MSVNLKTLLINIIDNTKDTDEWFQILQYLYLNFKDLSSEQIHNIIFPIIKNSSLNNKMEFVQIFNDVYYSNYDYVQDGGNAIIFNIAESDDDEISSWLLQTFDFKSWYPIVYTMICAKYPYEDECYDLVIKLNELIPESEIKIIDDLLQMEHNYQGIKDALNHIKSNIISNKNNFYVKNFNITEDQILKIEKTRITREEATKIIDSAFSGHDQSKSLVLENIDLMLDNPELYEIIQQSVFNLNLNIYRYMGPSNINVSSTYDDCLRLGRCRMFACVCRNYNDQDSELIEENDEEWFRNVCDQCNKGINNICNALRIAHEEGGWIGCFCSDNCIFEYLDKTETLSNKEDKLRITKIHLAEIAKTGIQSR